MSDSEELREQLDEERKARQSLQVDLDRLEERVDTLRGIVREHVVATDGGADGD